MSHVGVGCEAKSAVGLLRLLHKVRLLGCCIDQPVPVWTGHRLMWWKWLLLLVKVPNFGAKKDTLHSFDALSWPTKRSGLYKKGSEQNSLTVKRPFADIMYNCDAESFSCSLRSLYSPKWIVKIEQIVCPRCNFVDTTDRGSQFRLQYVDCCEYPDLVDEWIRGMEGLFWWCPSVPRSSWIGLGGMGRK